MGLCRLDIASPVMASIDVFLVGAVHESMSERRGNNELVRVGYVALHHLSQISPTPHHAA
jgi:hypothetical protein